MKLIVKVSLSLSPSSSSLSSSSSSALRLGFVKYQVSGRAPAIEETEEEKEKSIKLMTTQRMMQNLFGFNPSELECESDEVLMMK